MADGPNIEPQEPEDKNHPTPEEHRDPPPEQFFRAKLEIPQTVIDKYDADQQKKDIQSRKKFRIEVATLIVILCYTTFAGYQSCMMREATKAAKKSADAATSAAKTAKDTLDQNKTSTVDTLAEMTKQSRAMQASADLTKETVKQSKASLNAAIEHFRLEQRAWVGLVEVSPAEYTEGDKRVYVKEGQKIKGGVRIVNSGKTPALNVHNVYNFRSLNLGIDPFTTFKTPEIFESTTIMQPGMATFLSLPPIPTEGIVTKANVDDIANGKIIIYIIGIVTYDDIFKRPHISKFCLHLKTDLTAFNTCTANNEAD